MVKSLLKGVMRLTIIIIIYLLSIYEMKNNNLEACIDELEKIIEVIQIGLFFIVLAIQPCPLKKISVRNVLKCHKL